MILFNEQNQQLNMDTVKAELSDLDTMSTPTLEEAQSALRDYYRQALALEGNKYQFSAEFAMPGFLGNIFDKIKKIICGVLNDSSTEGEIIDAVLAALSAVIPGAILISALAKIVIKYILSTGITAFCTVV